MTEKRIEQRDLREIYRLIYDKLRSIQKDKKFDENIKRLNNEVERKAYRKKDDEFFFRNMISVVYDSGLRAELTVNQKEEIMNAFPNIKVVLEYDEGTVEQLKKHPFWVIRNERKIRACINNAETMRVIIQTFGSFPKYIDFFEGVECLVYNIMKKFDFMKETNAGGFLKYVGVDCIKYDRHIRRVLSRLGLIKENDPYNIVFNVGKSMAKATRKKLSVIDEVIYVYGSGDKRYVSKAICTKRNPKCSECNLTNFCIKSI